MRFIFGGVNGNYIRELQESALGKTDVVFASVAYVTSPDLLDWCIEKNVPLKLWGRFDDEAPVSSNILDKFIRLKSLNYQCKLIRHFHSKVIWWKGYGAYIGSANLTHRAWYNNVEAGCFFTEDELSAANLSLELNDYFSFIDKHSSPITEEIVELIKKREASIYKNKNNDKNASEKFLSTDYVQKWGGLTTHAPIAAIDRRKGEFTKEWIETLQILRNISKILSIESNRPAWISSDIPGGAQTDQFLHAHYYNRTMEGVHALYEEWYSKNKNNPEAALNDAIAWWRALESAPSHEDITLKEWSPLLIRLLSQSELLKLTEGGFTDICLRIHAIRDHAKRVGNKLLGLSGTQAYEVDFKTQVFAKYLYSNRSEAGRTVLETINFVLYDGSFDDVPQRIWAAITEPEWKIDHFGVSAIGEVVGWALPERFPPRNGRTSKALRSLGYDVTVHSS